MKLHSYWRSSCTYRVRIALFVKGVAYDLVPVHLLKDGGQQHRPEYQALNPMGQVPLLEVEEGGVTRVIAQSMAILEYLEERYPDPPILPKDRYLRAKARQLAETVNAGIQPFQNTSTAKWVKDELKADETAWVRHWMTRGLDALERSTAEVAGRYSVGEDVSIADMCLVPQMYAAQRVGVEMSGWPTLVRVAKACGELPAFQAAHPDRQPDAGR